MLVPDKVWVSFRRNKLHIFDKKTEKAIVFGPADVP